MTGSVSSELEALRRFFLFCYQEEVSKRYVIFQAIFPLMGGSRLDMVRLNGGARVHFLYQNHDVEENLVLIHDLTVVLGSCTRQEELAFVRRALNARRPLVHFVLEPPFLERFSEVEGEARAAVERHARMRPDVPGHN